MADLIHPQDDLAFLIPDDPYGNCDIQHVVRAHQEKKISTPVEEPNPWELLHPSELDPNLVRCVKCAKRDKVGMCSHKGEFVRRTSSCDAYIVRSSLQQTNN